VVLVTQQVTFDCVKNKAVRISVRPSRGLRIESALTVTTNGNSETTCHIRWGQNNNISDSDFVDVGKGFNFYIQDNWFDTVEVSFYGSFPVSTQKQTITITTSTGAIDNKTVLDDATQVNALIVNPLSAPVIAWIAEPRASWTRFDMAPLDAAYDVTTSTNNVWVNLQPGSTASYSTFVKYMEFLVVPYDYSGTGVLHFRRNSTASSMAYGFARVSSTSVVCSPVRVNIFDYFTGDFGYVSATNAIFQVKVYL
jgi:hypothetical protein